LVGGAVAVPAAAGTSPTGGSVEEPTVLAKSDQVTVIQDGDWVRHEYVQPLPNAKTQEIAGTHLTGPDGTQGCGYRGSETAEANSLSRDEVLYSREIASNLEDCTLVLETAVLSVDEAKEFGVADDDASDESKVASSDGLTTNATTTGKYQKLYYEDPPQIDVTSVTARLRWTWTGSCTTWSQHQAAWGWYSSSGWSRTNSWYGYDYANCAYGATTSNTGQYRNGSFCASVDTWNEYYTNYLQGHSDGSSYYEWSANKWGGCANLLSFHRAVGTW
jgi:hypothetical protein